MKFYRSIPFVLLMLAPRLLLADADIGRPLPIISIDAPERSPQTGILFQLGGQLGPDSEFQLGTVTVSQMSVPGTFERVTDGGDRLYLFKADVEIPIGTATIEGNVDGLNIWTNTTIVDLVPEPKLTGIAFDVSDVISERNCCDDSLGNELCWGTAYAKGVNASVDFNDVPRGLVSTLNRAALTVDGVEIAANVAGIPNRDLLLSTSENPMGEVCVTASLTTFDGTTIDEQTDCVSASDLSGFDEPSNVEIDDPIASQCQTIPDDPEDPNWIKYAPRGESGGCSTTPTSGPNLLLLFLLGIAFMMSRRLRFDQN